MQNSNDLISRIRHYYKRIYDWYKKNYRSTIEKIANNNNQWGEGNENVNRYRKAVEDMPNPQKATLEEIRFVAHQVRSGILEWNYGAMITEDMSLGYVAGEIATLLEENESIAEFDRLKETVYAISEDNISEDSEYFAKADDVYRIILLDNERNIGGRVALADTNWELHKSNNNSNRVLFRKADGLNLTEIHEEDNLFQLVVNGTISIDDINIR